MNLVIAEKPSVAQSIATVIGATNRKDGYMEGNGYFVTWCVGHLVGLAPADYYDEKYAKWQYEDLPILPKEWGYVISKGKEKQMKIISELMKRADIAEVIEATDSGREGELIFRLVYEKLGCTKPIKRLWISSMEESAIAKGFKNLRNGADYELLYQSALYRAKADWIIGINATRLFSVLYGQTLNIGRVMSPTLAMIVEREASVLAFKPEPFYTVQLDCGAFTLSSDGMNDKQVVETLCKTFDGKSITIEEVNNKEKAEKPPKLYDLTTLQREANRQLGFTAEQTLEYAQSLYEKKLITYPRTDSRYLTEDMKSNTPAVVNASTGFFMPENAQIPINMAQVIDNSKVSDHHAIIPTMSVKDCDIDSLPFGEREILLLIALRLICAVGESFRYAETIVKASCNDTIFTAKGRTVLADGFKTIEKLYLASKNKQPKEDKDKALPPINQGEVFTVSSTIKEGKTSPPKHYTDDTLLSAMENANNALEDMDRKGIGTPATRAGILEKLIKTGFAERKGDKKTKYFIPTHKGISLITVLPEVIKSAQLTAEWEEHLKQIEHGTLSPQTFLDDISMMTKDLVSTYKVIEGANTLFPPNRKGESIGKCPRCGSEVIENKKGFCCENRACHFALWKENKFFTIKKKTLTKSIAIDLLKKGEASLTGCYSEKTGKTYDAIVILDDKGGKYVNFKMEFPKKKGGKK
ncbi:DNA topoisomerase III [Clostridium tetani]|uniref:DNA topoisomerase 3 n=1 Tax=Clostridium tetani TaxID=1513 RepID=UPI00100C161D|nr:DNA topoisomerase 3 [Clostridium tetani]RXI40162.1 DNA topoisomerase III [Clostridium tetani]